MAKADAGSTTSRRTLLGAIAAAPVAGALAAQAVAPDPHVQWLATIEDAWRQMDDAPELDDQETSRLWDEVAQCQDLIAETPAHSFEGVIAQIKVGHHSAEGLASHEVGMEALDRAVAAIRAIAGLA